jgi:hypothetical protein
MTLVAWSAIAAAALGLALTVSSSHRSPGRVRSALQIGLGLALAVLLTSGALALVGWPGRHYLSDDTQRAWNRNLDVVSGLCYQDERWAAEQEADFRRAVDALVDTVDDHGDEWSSSIVAASFDERTGEQLDGWAARYRANRCRAPAGAGSYLVEAVEQ